MNEKNLIDNAFYVKKQRWGTWVSYDEKDQSLITSLTEQLCIEATRFYLKGRQEGFSEPEKVHEGVVGGKL